MTTTDGNIPFVQGQQVIDKSEPGNIAEYTGKCRRIGSVLTIELRFQNGNLRYRPLASVIAIQQGKTSSLLEQMQDELFGSLADLRQLITYEKLKGSLHDIVYSMETAQIDFYPYQYKPVIKFINSPSERLLLADEVGLGKTIEAALIWMEMQARYQAKRLFIVCPKILAEKWREELQQKFLIDAKIVNFHELQHEVANLKKYGVNYPFALIGTYSGLRPPKISRDELKTPPEEDMKSSPKVQLLRELRFWAEEYPPLDLVIFDEAHYMRNQATTTFLLGESLSAMARAILCISATPVNNSNIDLHSLLRLIDENFFATQSSFDSLIQSNRPAVVASNALSRHPVEQDTLFKALDDMSAIPHIKNSPYLPELIKKLEALAQSNFADPSLLAKCQDIAEKMNVLGSYINRTRRVQVQENRPIRDVNVISVEYTSGEMCFYQAILDAVRRYCLKNNSEFHVFQVMTWQLMAASCLPAFVEKIKSGRENESNDLLAEAFGDAETEEAATSTLGQEIASWSNLLNYDFEANDSKLMQLISLLQSEPNEKIIIFSYYRGTLSYLQRKLEEHGELTAVIHGGIQVEKRWMEIERFRSPVGSRILLASEVASEGIDLQFCRILINYDLPWNPMRVEQRIGRIDRIGQTAPRLSIVNFKIKDTIEERIYVRLHEKLAKFSNSLGDLDEVLGKEIKKLTIDLISKKLTPEQADRRISQTQQAIEKKLLDIQHLEESGVGLIALSDYVQKRIEEDRGRGRYIQPAELEAYVFSFFERFYKGTVINHNTPFQGCLQITLSDDARESLFNYIRNDRTMIVSQLRQRTIDMTFDRKIVQRMHSKRKIIFVNHMSPFIRWITKFNKDQEYNLHKISAVTSNTPLLKNGTYMFRIDRWSLKGIINREKLAYGFISLENGECVSSYDAENIFQDIFKNGAEWKYREYNTYIILERYNSLEEYMDAQFSEEAKDFERENENMIHIKRQRISTIFMRKIEQDRQRLVTLIENKRGEQIINMTKARIKKNEDYLGNRLEKLKMSSEVEPDANTVALGIVKVGI
jgi:SNF2 family DNA or RNA helicase